MDNGRFFVGIFFNPLDCYWGDEVNNKNWEFEIIIDFKSFVGELPSDSAKESIGKYIANAFRSIKNAEKLIIVSAGRSCWGRHRRSFVVTGFIDGKYNYLEVVNILDRHLMGDVQQKINDFFINLDPAIIYREGGYIDLSRHLRKFRIKK